MKFVGRRLLYRYRSGLQVEGHFPTSTELSWKAVTGPAAGKVGTESIRAVQLAPALFFISWLEKSGTTVSQILDLDAGRVHAFVTVDAGQGRQAFLDEGEITDLAP